MKKHLPPELVTGIAAIDEAHENIFRIFNDLLKACDRGRGSEKIEELFRFLDGYVLDHFRVEELSQAESGYPCREEHAQQHREFQLQVLELKSMFERQGRSVTLLVKALRVLAQWLFEHVEVADRRFTTYLQNRPLSAIPDPVDTVVTEV